ncbi:hypothetical protein CHARACLAT_014232, partial [Characodon lateralis]|nr:hypothetical protein [Characodon lateralis]
MKCVCMFLSASGDVEVGLQAPRKLGEPTRSTQPLRKCAFLTEPTQNLNFILFYFSSRLSQTSRLRVRIVSLEKEAFGAPVFPSLLSFSFFSHHSPRRGWERHGPLGLWEPSPLIESAL